MTTSPILYAYQLAPDGNWTEFELPEDGASGEVLRPAALTWIHLDHRHPDMKDWINRNLADLDPIILDALTSEAPRPRLEEFEEGLLLLLRAANLNEGQNPHDMISVRTWTDPSRIITIVGRPVRAVGDLQARVTSARPPKAPGDFIALLNMFLIDRMEGVITRLDEETDDLEARILDHPDMAVRQAIIGARQQAIMFRRFIAPQRDVLSRLRMLEHPLIQKKQKLSLQDSLDYLQRFIEDLDAIRERAQVVQDELTNAISEKLNERLYLLSIITAIFLPLGFFTGLLGINVGGIPGTDVSSAFFIVCGIVMAIVAAQIVWFKWMRWF